MRIQEEAVLETLRRVQVFLQDKDEILGALNQSGARKRLDETAEEMAAHVVNQVAGRRMAQGETAKQRALRAELRYDHMQPIAIIAGQRLREQPEFKLLRLPRWKTRSAELIVNARDMANAAEKYASLFVEEGLAPDFMSELRAVADQLEKSIDARGQNRGQRAGATAGLKAAAKRGRVRIRLLDSLVRRRLGTNDQLLSEWKTASHIQRQRRPASGAPSGESSPAAATAVVPVPTVSATPESVPVAA